MRRAQSVPTPNLTVERSTVKITGEMTHPRPSSDPTYSVNELADHAGVTRRTVHYYIAQGLLPAAGTEGPGTRYRRGHLDRLMLIRELQREHLPLSEIRQRLERLNDDQVADLLATGDMLPEPKGTAFDYIQSVLAGTARRSFSLPPPPRPPSTPPIAAMVAPPAPGQASPTTIARAAAERPPAEPAQIQSLQEAPPASAGTGAPNSNRSQWERIALNPDVELHVRRPLGRIQNRAVDRLIALARQLLEEGQQ